MKKKTIKKPTRLTAAQYQEIYDLYWDDNYSQKELTQMYGLSDNTGHISRIVNSQSFPHHRSILLKQDHYEKNYIVPKKEAPQAKTIRITRRKNGGLHKLTLIKARQIRKLWFGGKHTQMALAKKYGVNQSTITRLIQGRYWKKEQ